MIDVIENETLKTRPDSANKDWQRLLLIMSKYFAVDEGIGTMTLSEDNDYKQELIKLNSTLSMYHKLDNFQGAFQVKEIQKRSKTSAYTLLYYDADKKTGLASTYSKADEKKALKRYSELEESQSTGALLIAGADIKSIEKAYPNYIIDTTEFLKRFSEIVFN